MKKIVSKISNSSYMGNYLDSFSDKDIAILTIKGAVCMVNMANANR